MKGAELRMIRRKLHLTKFEFGRLLGYQAERKPLVVLIHRLENGRKSIPAYIARLAWLIDRVYDLNLGLYQAGRISGLEVVYPLPTTRGLLPDFPAWPEYLPLSEEAGPAP